MRSRKNFSLQWGNQVINNGLLKKNMKTMKNILQGGSMGFFRVITYLRLDYQPLFGKMSPHSSPRRRGEDQDRTRETAEIEPILISFISFSPVHTKMLKRRKQGNTSTGEKCTESPYVLWNFTWSVMKHTSIPYRECVMPEARDVFYSITSIFVLPLVSN